MDGYKRRSQERSQSVRRSKEEGGDAERITLMDTSRLSNYAADGLSLREGEKEDLGSDERRKEGVKLGTSEGRNAKGEERD